MTKYRSLSEVPPNLLIDRAKGCLLGGALGDALGAPVEFMSRSAILGKFPPDGICDFHPAYGLVGAITDDTQMTLFSAEGLIRATVRGGLRGVCHPPTVVGYAYQRWMKTQGEKWHPDATSGGAEGYLVNVSELHHRRAPGNTCISALRLWNREPATNDSKGCGTVMRSAPFGFFPRPWETAWESAAVSHGHIEAKASAAILAVTIEQIVLGDDLESALLTACAQDKDLTLSSQLVRRAITLAKGETAPEVAVSSLGLGWVAEEALATAAFCALRAKDNFWLGVQWAVNHDGDSDSTGAICGNLMGAVLGLSALPTQFLEQLELRRVIEQLAEDMIGVQLTRDLDSYFDRYPGC